MLWIVMVYLLIIHQLIVIFIVSFVRVKLHNLLSLCGCEVSTGRHTWGHSIQPIINSWPGFMMLLSIEKKSWLGGGGLLKVPEKPWQLSFCNFLLSPPRAAGREMRDLKGLFVFLWKTEAWCIFFQPIKNLNTCEMILCLRTHFKL